MVELFTQIDYAAFEWVHHTTANGVFDEVMPFLRNKYVWVPLYVFLISYFLINFGKRGGGYVIFVLMVVGLADFTSSQVVKPAVERPRPCKNVSLNNYTEPLVDCGSGYSFTSSHATNHMAVAIFIILTTASLWRIHRWWFLLWAVLIGYAQIYVGVHYPIDILGGFLLGTLIAWGVFSLYNYFFPQLYFDETISKNE